MEQCRSLLEKEGVRVAAISYDFQKTLHNFAQQHEIGFPLLSDPDSAVIRSFGILNTNIAPELRAHGVPHPVQYLAAPDGAMVRKYFVPNYQLASRRRLSLCANSESRVTARQSLHCATARSPCKLAFRRPGNRFFREIRARARLAYLWLAASGELHSDFSPVRRSEDYAPEFSAAASHADTNRRAGRNAARLQWRISRFGFAAAQIPSR